MFLHLPAAFPEFILRTTDRELQHTGWVKINAGTAAGRCRNILNEIKGLKSISKQGSTFSEVFIF
jgi:hypothetical protein